MEQENPQHLQNRELLQAIQLQQPNNVIDSIQRGADPSFGSNTPIKIASRYPNTQVVSILLADPRVNPSVEDNMPLRLAANAGLIQNVNVLLRDSRVDPSANNNQALRDALEFGYWEVVQRLIWDNRVDPSVRHSEALKRAIQVGDVLVIKVLLSDPRVDWRLIRGTQYEPNFYHVIAKKKEALRKSMLPLLGVIKENKTFIGGKEATQAIGRRAAFEYGISLLCQDLREGLVPTVEIVELIRMLHVTGYFNDDEAKVIQNLGSKRDACERIRYALDRFKDDQIGDVTKQGELKRRRV